MWNAVYLRHIAHFLHALEVLGSLLRDSFPALHSVKVISRASPEFDEPEGGRVPSLLHAIVVGRPIPGTLKTIVLQHNHRSRTGWCCREDVGTREEAVDSEQRLPEFLVGLSELVVRLDQCVTPGTCATYIGSVLRGLGVVLRLEYRTWLTDEWITYTLPGVQ